MQSQSRNLRIEYHTVILWRLVPEFYMVVHCYNHCEHHSNDIRHMQK
jgi:hypothetical protein